MTDLQDAAADLLVAAARARDLADEVAGVVLRAEALARETGWRASAATVFRVGVRAWSADLAGIRSQLAELADDTGAAAAAARHRLELSTVATLQ